MFPKGNFECQFEILKATQKFECQYEDLDA